MLTSCAADRSPADRTSSSGSTAAGQGELNRCRLLTAAELEAAIGPSDAGTTGLSNTWGTQSCRWTAAKAQPMQEYPDGWHDAVEVAVFDATATPMMRSQVTGDPVAGALPGAVYDNSYGDLWFDCPGKRLCVVKVRTASGDRRQETATRLAGLVASRLK
jgi:hypothetical protein